MIYSLAGIMQLGIGVIVVAASPLYNDGSQRIIQLDDKQDQHDRQRREEIRRHEREMQRHDHESDQDWNQRQWIENQRHDNAMHEIEAG